MCGGNQIARYPRGSSRRGLAIDGSRKGRADHPPPSRAAITSLRRRDFFFDLDRRDIERAVGQFWGTSDEHFEARLQIILRAGNRGGDDSLRRHDEFLLLIWLARNLVLHRQRLAVDAGDRGLQ